jgi:hypothetical protein
MAATLLQGPDDFLRAYAAASADWSSYQRSGVAEFLRIAPSRLCGAGRAVLEDHGFWMNLETELGAQVGPAWQEFVQRRQEFLDLEQSIVIAGAQMNDTDAVVLITELEAAIGSFVATAGNINAASHIIQTAAFRTRFETLNNSVCSAGIAHLQEKNQPPRKRTPKNGLSCISRSESRRWHWAHGPQQRRRGRSYYPSFCDSSRRWNRPRFAGRRTSHVAELRASGVSAG